MKKYLNYIGLAILSMVLFSCSKEETFNYPPGTVGISKITNYAEFELTGPDYIYLAKGTAYVEPGVKATEAGTEIDVKTSGSVDKNTAGVYTLTYSAINKDGFSASASRTVVVYDTDESAAANDFSGQYARNTNGSVAEWTKVAPGVYQVFNPGGAPGTNVTLIVFNQTGSEVFIPHQIFGGTVWDSGTESSTPGEAGTLAQYKWQVLNVGYGTAVRTFDKI